MTLRYTKVKFYPRIQVESARGAKSWVPDLENPIEIRMGISGDRATRAEVRGDVEIEVYNVRLPFDTPGVGPGARLRWDDSDWDIAAPPFLRPTRTHSVRHLTTQIRRRPYREGDRE